MRIGTLKHRYTGRKKRVLLFREQPVGERLARAGGIIITMAFAIAYSVIIVGEMGWAR